MTEESDLSKFIIPKEIHENTEDKLKVSRVKEFINIFNEKMKDKQKYFRQPNWAIKELIEEF
ncbi:unnamed protein product, partial [marine sediment metagenome]